VEGYNLGVLCRYICKKITGNEQHTLTNIKEDAAEEDESD